MKKTEITVTLISVLLITLLLFASVPSLNAVAEAPPPQWSRTYTRMLNYSINGFPVSAKDGGRFVIQTTDGGYAIFAELDDYHFRVDNRTSIIIKTDSSGEVQWEKGNSIITSNLRSIFQTKDSGFLLAGGNQLLKLDAEGNGQWSKNFSSYFVAIQASDGGYVLAGFIPGYDVVSMLLKTDEKGNLLWNKTFSASSGWSSAYGVVETNDGGYAVAGYRDGAWFAVTDSDGNLKLSQNFPDIEGRFTSIAKTEEGGFILVGGTSPGGINMQGQAFIVKVDSEGKMQWNHAYNNPPYEGFWFSSVAQTGDGEFIGAGYSALFKIDCSGNLEWYLTSATDVTDVLGSTDSVIAAEDGGFVVVGSKKSSVWLAKFAPESTTIPDNTFPQPGETSPFSTTCIVVAVIIVAVVGLGLLVYFKKRKR